MNQVTHVLNTATEHVVVNPEKYPAYDIKYHGFHVDDLPEANISRYKLPFCAISVLTSTPLEDHYLVFFGPFLFGLTSAFYPLSRYFHTTTKFIDQAVSSGGLIVVNCVMGWSRFFDQIDNFFSSKFDKYFQNLTNIFKI